MVLQLVDEGLIDFDEPLATYLPDVVLGDDVPIRLLLRGRDGLPCYSDDQAWLAAALRGDRSRSFTPDKLLAVVADTPPISPDEQIDNVHCTQTVLLRQLIEELDGTDIRTALQTRIVERLGLEATVFAGNGTPLPDDPAVGWDRFARLVGDSESRRALLPGLF